MVQLNQPSATGVMRQTTGHIIIPINSYRRAIAK
jgi:hypothetical protein